MAIAATLLALACGGLVVAVKRVHDEALCWRAVAEDGEAPPEGDCRRL